MKMYIVAYSSGSYEDWREHLIFATQDKEMAEKYIEKANSILTKWLSFYLGKATEEYEKEIEEWVFMRRYSCLEDINSFYIMEIEIR